MITFSMDKRLYPILVRQLECMQCSMNESLRCNAMKCCECSAMLSRAEDAVDPHIPCARVCFACTIAAVMRAGVDLGKDEISRAKEWAQHLWNTCEALALPIPFAIQEMCRSLGVSKASPIYDLDAIGLGSEDA